MVNTKDSYSGANISTAIMEANRIRKQLLDYVVIIAVYQSSSYNNISTFLTSLNEKVQKYNEIIMCAMAVDVNINIIEGKHH